MVLALWSLVIFLLHWKFYESQSPCLCFLSHPHYSKQYLVLSSFSVEISQKNYFFCIFVVLKNWIWGIFKKTYPFNFHSTTTASEEDVSSRFPRTDRSGFSRYNRDANASGNLVSSSTLEKKIEDLEKVWITNYLRPIKLIYH